MKDIERWTGMRDRYIKKLEGLNKESERIIDTIIKISNKIKEATK